MADKKYDWSETDRVMDELRRQLAAEQELIAGMTAPGIADVLAEAAVAASAEEIPVEATAPDDPSLVLSMHNDGAASAEMPDGEAPIGAESAGEATADVAPGDDAPVEDAPVEDAPAAEATPVEEEKKDE